MTETVEVSATEIEQLHAEIATLRTEVEGLREEKQELRDEVQSYRESNERDKAEIRQQVTEIEAEGTATDENASETAETVGVEPETPLENVVALPEHIAEVQILANQSRARFVATDVTDYAQKTSAGYSVTDTDLRKVLIARNGETAHSQTVARVIEFLDRLGGDAVDVVKRRGTKWVVFDEQPSDGYWNSVHRDRRRPAARLTEL